MEIIELCNFGDEMEMDRWHNSMLWCPSQCYCHKVDNNGVHYILYLRWRWNDPWGAYIIKGAHNEKTMGEGEWGNDIFDERDIYFADHEDEQARAMIERIFKELI